MRLPKIYGQSKVDKCPFCEHNAMSMNKQGVPTCKDHADESLPDMKCVCGEYLDMRQGKFGVFFNCINCGAVNLRKALEVNDVKKKALPYKMQSTGQGNQEKKPAHYMKSSREFTVRSDDPRFFD